MIEDSLVLLSGVGVWYGMVWYGTVWYAIVYIFYVKAAILGPEGM